MHIAFMIGSLACGGTERVLINLTDHLISRGHKITVVTLYKNKEEYPLNPSADRILWDLTEEELTSSRIRNFTKRLNKLTGIWKDVKPDVVLSFIGKNNFMALLTAKKLNIPVAVAVRGEPKEEYYTRWLRMMAKHLYKKADAVVFQTKMQEEFFPKKVKDKGIILKNPLNKAVFETEALPFEQREAMIVSAGRVDENKNHKMLIDAFMNISEDHPEYRLVIYGDGPERKKLKEYVESKGFEGKIDLPGREDDIADKIKIARVFVLPSDTEGSPNALLEAMVLGLACISTDCPCGGPAEIISDGENGILVPVRDTAKMQVALQNFLNNLQTIERIASKAVSTRDIYSPENVLKEWESMLINLVNKANCK